MKLLLETTGAFMLNYDGQQLPAHRPAVIVTNPFFESRIALGQVKNLGKLTDEADDRTFAEYVRESRGDLPLAVESFLSSFSPAVVTTK